VTEALWLGVVFGIGAGFSVGPVFVTIVQEAIARGFGAASKVILGSATADLVLIVPALAASWLLARVEAAAGIVALVGAAYFLYLAVEAGRGSWRLWRDEAPKAEAAPVAGWAFWKGALGNLLNPLSWGFWLATGTPTMMRALGAAGWPGLALFTATWFGVAMAIEAIVAGLAAGTRRALRPRALAVLNAASCLTFGAIAVSLVLQVGPQ
jgi:threonine/homoserine/homoserine lactone efflux protein